MRNKGVASISLEQGHHLMVACLFLRIVCIPIRSGGEPGAQPENYPVVVQ